MCVKQLKASWNKIEIISQFAHLSSLSSVRVWFQTGFEWNPLVALLPVLGCVALELSSYAPLSSPHSSWTSTVLSDDFWDTGCPLYCDLRAVMVSVVTLQGPASVQLTEQNVPCILPWQLQFSIINLSISWSLCECQIISEIYLHLFFGYHDVFLDAKHVALSSTHTHLIIWHSNITWDQEYQTFLEAGT